MRPHDETVRAAIEQSLGNTLKTLCAPATTSGGLFTRRPALWKATLTALERWSPALAEQLSSVEGLQPIATVSSVVSTEEGAPEEAAAVVTAVVLEGVGAASREEATPKTEEKDAAAEGVVFQQPGAVPGETDEEENCVVQ